MREYPAGFVAGIVQRFSRHAPDDDQDARMCLVRDDFKTLVGSVLDNVPPGREQALVLTKLEEALFFATAAIAREGST